jgi:hypothetical protein
VSRRQQWLKWAIYALLLLDFFLYVRDDWVSKPFTLGADPGLGDWARAYVTSIDVAAWLVLLLLFELETGIFADRRMSSAMTSAVRGVRLICCVAILNTTYADAVALREFQQPRKLPAAADLCAYADTEWSLLRNREYTAVSDSNCAHIAHGPDFFAVGNADVLTDRAGLREGLMLAWTDLVENVAWLLVVLVSELAVRVKGRVVATGSRRLPVERCKVPLYALILGIAFYWGSKGQLLYLWDELLWVCGFLAIDRNLLDRVAMPKTHEPTMGTPS